MKDAILKLLRRHRGESLNARQIAHHLGLASGQHRTLRHDLKFLINEGKLLIDRNQRYAARDENRVLKGIVRLHRDGFGFLTPEDRKKEDVFVPRRHLNTAMNGDTVLVESFRGGDGRYEGRVIQVVAHANTTVVGTVKALGDQYFVMIRDSRLGLEELYIPRKHLNKVAVGDFVAVKITQYPGHGIVPVGEISHVIGVESDEASLKEAALIKRGIARKFPEAVKHGLESLPAEVDDESLPGREDLRDLPIITIDGVTAKDFDDAVCAQKRGKTTVLWVSIADVAEYVGIGSVLDKEAYRRGTSTYLPDECVPMLPEKLSNGLCSLNPHVSRLTLTAELHYNADGVVTIARFYRSVIRSVKRATYDEVQAYFNGTGGADMPPAVKSSLDVMKTLSEILIRRADKRGTLGFDLPEAEFLFDGRGAVASIRKRPRFFSHRLIEQFMVAANVAVAQVFSYGGMPLLYRIHDVPDPAKMQNFLDMARNMGVAFKTTGFNPAVFFKSISGQPRETFLQTSFLRSLKQAVYSPENIGHYGLALKDYAHFTSPIRRYPDLIVHRQLRALLEQSRGGVVEFDPRQESRRSYSANPRLPYSFSELTTIGDAASKRERDSMDAEREVADIKRAVFMRSHLHEKFFGTICRVTRLGLNVELEPHFVEGFLQLKDMHDDYYIFDEHKFKLTGRRNRAVLSIGDKIHVEVSAVDEATAQIRLKLAQEMVQRKKKR